MTPHAFVVRKWRASLALLCMGSAIGMVVMAPFRASAYAEGSYYAQASYYAQGYYQAAYSGGAGGATGVQNHIFTYTGSTQTFTVPAGVTSLRVALIGGGGGGGGGAADWGGGGGGGCGAAIAAQTVSVSPGQSISVTVGAGGAGGANSINAGASGGVSSFGSISAVGGGYGGSGYYGYPNVRGPAGGSGGGSSGGGGGNAYPGFYAVPGKGGTNGAYTNSIGSGGYCTGSGWSTSLSGYITKSSYLPGSGGYAPSSYAYCGGGGGGGLVIDSSSVGGASGLAPTSGTWGPSCAPNGGAGYGGGGGGSYYSGGPAYGGAGAPGVVYVEWDAGPASCSVSISPNPATYSSSGTATLTWTSTNADSWTQISNVGTLTGSGGSFTVPRTATTDYSCYAQGTGGSDGWHSYALTIIPPSTPTATVTSSLGSTMQVGQSSTISATITPGSGDSVTSANVDSPVGTGLAANTNPGVKTYIFTPSSAGTYTFYARARTSYFTDWTTYAQTAVTVQAPCIVGGLTLQSGESATFYSSQTAPSGAICTGTSGGVALSQTRTCTNGVLSGSSSYQYASCSCAAVYSCSGNNVQYTNSSCETSDVTSCTSPAFCSAGSAACLYSPPTFNPGEDGLTGHLQASPSLLPEGLPTRIHWDVSAVSSCTVTGSNGDTWTGISGSHFSSPINQPATFILLCEGLDGSTVNETQTVNILPVFGEF